MVICTMTFLRDLNLREYTRFGENLPAAKCLVRHFGEPTQVSGRIVAFLGVSEAVRSFFDIKASK
jgi:hypothetical protein